jgi:hypothetical protein
VFAIGWFPCDQTPLFGLQLLMLAGVVQIFRHRLTPTLQWLRRTQEHASPAAVVERGRAALSWLARNLKRPKVYTTVLALVALTAILGTYAATTHKPAQTTAKIVQVGSAEVLPSGAATQAQPRTSAAADDETPSGLASLSRRQLTGFGLMVLFVVVLAFVFFQGSRAQA